MTALPTSSTRPTRLPLWVALGFIYLYFAWGATYMGVHLALQSIPPFLMAGCRFVVAGWVLFGLLRVFSPVNFRWGTRGEWRDAWVVGTLLLVGGNGGLAWSQQYVNTSSAALIFGTLPLCLIFFDWIRPGGVAPSLRTGSGLVLGFIGLCVLIKPASSSPGGMMETWGKITLLGAAFSWAAGAIYSRHVQAQGSPLLPMARQMILGGGALLLVSALHGDWHHFSPVRVTLASWLGFTYLVVFGSLFGFTIYVWLMRVSTPARVGTIAYANLVVAVLLGWTIGGEVMTARTIVGAAITLSAVLLVLTKPQARALVAAEPTEA